jgi:hypothetical protein
MELRWWWGDGGVGLIYNYSWVSFSQLVCDVACAIIGFDGFGNTLAFALLSFSSSFWRVCGNLMARSNTVATRKEVADWEHG